MTSMKRGFLLGVVWDAPIHYRNPPYYSDVEWKRIPPAPPIPPLTIKSIPPTRPTYFDLLPGDLRRLVDEYDKGQLTFLCRYQAGGIRNLNSTSSHECYATHFHRTASYPELSESQLYTLIRLGYGSKLTLCDMFNIDDYRLIDGQRLLDSKRMGRPSALARTVLGGVATILRKRCHLIPFRNNTIRLYYWCQQMSVIDPIASELCGYFGDIRLTMWRDTCRQCGKDIGYRSRCKLCKARYANRHRYTLREMFLPVSTFLTC